MIDFGDHCYIVMVIWVKFNQMIVCPLSREFRPNLVDGIIRMDKRLD